MLRILLIKLITVISNKAAGKFFKGVKATKSPAFVRLGLSI